MIKTLTLGYAGEYGARMMTIDLSEEAAMWPDAAAQLLLVRPGEHTPYPADNAVYADGCMTFTPTKADMAIAGQGYAQVYFYGADGNVLGKSSMMITHILASLGGESTEPPSGDELGYYDKLMQQAALAIAAGASAQEDAQRAAESAAKAEAALEEMKNISTQSGNMPDGGSPGQILAKKSAENYDTHWIDPPSGSGTGGGVADSVAWDNVTDKPSTYPPAAHTHPEYLGKNETAANATQLNGKNADEYALKTDLTGGDVNIDLEEPEDAGDILLANADLLGGMTLEQLDIYFEKLRLEREHPVGGQPYITFLPAEQDDPNVKWPWTSWTLDNEASGRFLLGANGTYPAGSTGGEAAHSLTVDELAAHSHGPGPSSQRNWVPNSNYGRHQVPTGTSGPYVLGVESADYYVWGQTYPTGSGIAHNNMPPYLSVYMWKRTA